MLPSEYFDGSSTFATEYIKIKAKMTLGDSNEASNASKTMYFYVKMVAEIDYRPIWVPSGHQNGETVTMTVKIKPWFTWPDKQTFGYLFPLPNRDWCDIVDAADFGDDDGNNSDEVSDPDRVIVDEYLWGIYSEDTDNTYDRTWTNSKGEEVSLVKEL